MIARRFLALAAVCPALIPSLSAAQDVNYVTRDGVTYKETRRVVQQTVPVTRMEQREETVYRQRLHVENHETARTYYTPVTEYRYMTVMRGRWNPFVQPYYTQEFLPTTRWEARQEIVRMPVHRSEYVPERRVVQVPVTTTQLAETEMITRVPVQGGASGVGGVAQMNSDPPRNATQWKPAERTIQR